MLNKIKSISKYEFLKWHLKGSVSFASSVVNKNDYNH